MEKTSKKSVPNIFAEIGNVRKNGKDKTALLNTKLLSDRALTC